MAMGSEICWVCCGISAVNVHGANSRACQWGKAAQAFNTQHQVRAPEACKQCDTSRTITAWRFLIALLSTFLQLCDERDSLAAHPSDDHKVAQAPKLWWSHGCSTTFPSALHHEITLPP
ncbi:hypothetical protein BU26DRAFT_161294 [Trematosphaeria pertusa]|uniref:Uncharacterized protein n=1 Tax=Trematosphaeria pertusa TaxID=390896 RepID=A0A6A6HW63_9PLEO|nr:uncharacterized protein BU26DRAFT_161294 [Trematosphaeria pertusa]KAF2242444.1 hypothetical protein BU26DRAFT_161294 [Trematosphaeria pertusa]